MREKKSENVKKVAIFIKSILHSFLSVLIPQNTFPSLQPDPDFPPRLIGTRLVPLTENISPSPIIRYWKSQFPSKSAKHDTLNSPFAPVTRNSLLGI